jgi:PTH1 family peptidyl-tRNA hydrolase
VDEVARSKGASWKMENKFHGEVCRLSVSGEDVWLLKPNTFMNLSGKAVAALARFYKVSEESVLVVHDELDIPPGQVRLKQGGGHGGHNGLRDIIAQLGSREFYRLRLGIGHPGESRDVSDYVLGKASPDEQKHIDSAIDEALRTLPQILEGQWQPAMKHLHSIK